LFFLDPNDPVKKSLEQLCSSIAKISADCVQMIFGKECTISDDWKIVDRLNGDFTHNVCLGCGNNDFQALAVLGTGNNEISEFIDSLDANDILDAFGEMLNTYFGMLMDNAEFVMQFGILTQSIAQYSADVNFYPKAWGCSGTLVTPEKGSIYVGFAIKGNARS
jgi:hypothetical protein